MPPDVPAIGPHDASDVTAHIGNVARTRGASFHEVDIVLNRKGRR
jgi:hypothetical protein